MDYISDSVEIGIQNLKLKLCFISSYLIISCTHFARNSAFLQQKNNFEEAREKKNSMQN